MVSPALSRWTLLFTFYSLVFRFTVAEVFSALSHTERIHNIELELSDGLDDYIEEQENRLKVLKSFAGEVKRAVELSKGSPLSSYLGHPVNSYLMIKRFVNEWPKVEKLVDEESNAEGLLLDMIARAKPKFPDEDDLNGAITAIKRLQEVYDLKPVDFSEGRFGYKPHAGYILGPKDTYQIGRISYLNNDMKDTQEWMEETLRLMDLGVRNGTQYPSLEDVLDHLAYAEFKNGETEKAIGHEIELLKLDPTNKRVKNNVLVFSRDLEENREKYEKQREEKLKQIRPNYGWMASYLPQDVLANFNWNIERDIYKRLCRGERIPTPPQNHKRLNCWYFRKSPICIIRPCGMERVFTNPDITILRNIISDSEMEEVRRISVPLLNRATVHNPLTGKLETAHYRISKNCWLTSEKHGKVIGNVERRIAAMTKLNLQTAEEFQVTSEKHGKVIGNVERRIAAMTKLNLQTAEEFQVQNYGIAGHYDPHFDFSRNLTDSSLGTLGTGNRIATVLVYLSKVEEGGATVFPYIGARILPRKGDGVFWHNLLRSGEGDYRTRHAGCPVLSGVKWVANKWIHEYGNEFHRRCSLRRDE